MNGSDVMDVLLQSPESILSEEFRQEGSSLMDSDFLSAVNLSNWPSGVDDFGDIWNDLLSSNLDDDSKNQKLNKLADHDYTSTDFPKSPHSDSGVSSCGPQSPCSSSSNMEDLLRMDFDKELFGPLGLQEYVGESQAVHSTFTPSLTDDMSDSVSSPTSSEEAVDFDFSNLLTPEEDHPTNSVPVDNSKVIKVLTFNTKKNKSLLKHNVVVTQPALVNTNQPFPELRLSDEEKDLLRKEGISLPTNLPLTRNEEKILRSVRRRIRNKASARNSRKKKQEYMDTLEVRAKIYTDEKKKLEKKITTLEKQNTSLISQLKNLQKLVADSTKQTAKTGTCAMILALSFALVMLPNMESLTGCSRSADKTELLKQTITPGRSSRSLLSTENPSQKDNTFNYLPFVNLDKLKSFSPKISQALIDDPIEGDNMNDEVITIDDMVNPADKLETVELWDTSAEEAKVIHMEITKLPDSVQGVDLPVNYSAVTEPPLVISTHGNIGVRVKDEL